MSSQHTLGRAVGGVVAVALLGLVVPGQAGAAAPATYDARTVPVAGQERAGAAAEKPTRNISLRGRERSDDRFSVSGKVRPGYPDRVVVIERKLGEGRWSRYATVRTTDESRYRSRVEPRRVVGVVSYRATTPETGRYAASLSNNMYVITTEQG